MSNFKFRRNDHVDRHVITTEQIGPHRLKIALLANTGDFGRHVENRMRDLASDHVHFVRKGHGDDHVSVRNAGALKHIRVRSVSDDRLHIKGFVHFPDQVG